MQNLDEKEWKRISINSVFVIGHGFYNKKPPMSSEGEVPFIGASGINNGVTGFCTMQAIEDNSKVGYGPNEPIKRKLFNKGSICVVNNGSAIGYSYYQPKQFTCTHDVNPLTLRDHEMNEDEALFLAQMIRQQGDCFIYARKWRPSRMVSSQFLLPVDDKGNPDYAYMAEYVQQKRAAMLDKYHKYVEARIAELGELVEIPMLDEKEWDEFFIGDLFEVSRPKSRNKDDYDFGNTPFVASGALNNGVMKCCDAKQDEQLDAGNCITVSPVARTVRQTCSKYTYGHMGNKDSIKRERIMLPIDDSGKPDYEYMEQYAKNMMLRKYKQYLEFVNRQNVTEVDYMPRQKKDAKILNIKLAKEISDQLEQFCEESGISKTVATEKILSKYFEEYFSRPEEERTLFK